MAYGPGSGRKGDASWPDHICRGRISSDRPFTQEDPIGIAGGLNLYGYANGDPINHSDPFGLCVDGVSTWLCIAGAVWAAYEVGSAAYDVYNAARTAFSDASLGEKLTSVALAGVSVFGPGGGYTTVGDNLQNVRKISSGRLGGFLRGDTDLKGGLDAATDLFRSLTGREVAGSLDRAVLDDGREVLFRSGSRSGPAKIEIVDPDSKFLEKITFRGR